MTGTMPRGLFEVRTQSKKFMDHVWGDKELKDENDESTENPEMLDIPTAERQPQSDVIQNVQRYTGYLK